MPLQLGKYTPLARLASGGMGEVYVAQMSAAAGFEKTVVIKRLLPELARDEQFVKLFLDEARLTARLTHPNVCQVFELTEVEGEYYLVMEYLEGLSLAHLFHAYRGRGLDARVATGVCTQACEGLEYAHSFRDPDRGVDGVIHRDVSPHNLMLTVSGLVKLLDFGVAKLQREGSQTVTGSAKGKYAYMSPEQLHCEPLDRRSDVFSLAVVLFEILSGARLFRRKSELASMQAIVDGDRPQLVELKPELPLALSQVLDRALGVQRQARYPTARAFAGALNGAMSPSGGVASLSELAGFVLHNHLHELDAQRLRIKHATDRVAKLDPSELDETTIRSSRLRLPLRAPTATDVAKGKSLDLLARALSSPDDDDDDGDDEYDEHDLGDLPAMPATMVAGAGLGPNTATSASGLLEPRPPTPRRSRALIWMPMALVVLVAAGWLWHRENTRADDARESGAAAAPVASSTPASTPRSTPRPAADPPDLAEPPDLANPPAATDVSDASASDQADKPAAAEQPDKPAANVKRKRKRRERVVAAVAEDGQGKLTIDAVPYAEIYVDGRKLGVTPLVGVALATGEHAVKAVSSAGEKRLTIRIDKDKTTRRRITF